MNVREKIAELIAETDEEFIRRMEEVILEPSPDLDTRATRMIQLAETWKFIRNQLLEHMVTAMVRSEVEPIAAKEMIDKIRVMFEEAEKMDISSGPVQ